MEEIICSIDWKSTGVPCPGSHSSLPDDDVLPWMCVSEVIPGLYLTCESEVADREKCIVLGYALVINLCGDPHVTKYRVYETDEGGAHTFRRFEQQSDFYVELNNYCQSSLTVSPSTRKVFLVTIPAEDNPTYNIDVHFLECAVLMELVLRARDTSLLSVSDDSYASLPSVVAHCMVGVSRSAAVVTAYLMKKYCMSRDDAIQFIRCTRPVIQPNPGFQRQLELWEDLQGFRIVDELSAKVLSAETKAKSNLLDVVDTILPTILRTNKCDKERRFLGVLVNDASPSADDLHAVYRELRSVVTADVDCEVYTDIPNYFGYVAEVVCGVDAALPSLLQFAEFSKSLTVYSDTFYYRVVKDIARSGFEKDTFDTARGFCSLFEAIYVKHLCESGAGRPRSLRGGAAGVAAPAGCGLSFPFLYLVAPYAEGFVQFSEWGTLAETFATSGAVLAADDERQLINEVLSIVLQFFFRSSCGYAEEDATSSTDTYTKLGYLQEDVEIVTFRKLEEMWRSNTASIVSVDFQMEMPDSDNAQTTLLLLLKAISGILAFRLVLEAAEQFLTQTYASRLSGGGNVAEKVLPIPVITAAITGLDASYVERYAESPNIMDFFKNELASLRENGVLNAAGVASLFYPTV